MNTKAAGYSRVLRAISLPSAVAMTASLLTIDSATADSVEDMCLHSDEICVCAARQLKTEVGNDNYDLYEAIGLAYIANKTNGMNRGDAWDAAVKAESNKRGTGFAKTLNQTNAIGKAHRKAINSCAG